VTVALSVVEPRFLTIEEITTLHETAIFQHGGSLGQRDKAALESALAQPRHVFDDQFAHAFPFDMAAVYAFHICMNHPFVDGNKRTAFAAAVVFLRLNGFNLEADENDAAEMMLAITTSEMDKEAISCWLAKHSRKRSSMELRDFFSQLTLLKLMDTARSIQPDHGTRLVEGETSVLEAAQSMPVVEEMHPLVTSLAENKPEDADTKSMIHVFRTFLAMHRIAEEMGYEW